MNLPLKAKLFVSFYCGASNGNATDAARRAGYKQPKMAGTRLMSKDAIRAAVEAKVSALIMGQDELLIRMGEIGTSNMGDLITIVDNGFRVDVRKVKRLGHLIKRLKMTKDGPEVELEPRMTALIKIGEYLGLWDRDKPPDVSLVELAKRLKQRFEASK
jgi:Terminase small subunit